MTTLTEARPLESGGLRGLEAATNRVREDAAGPAAPVAFRAVSAVVFGSGTITVAKPAGVVTGDLLLIYAHSNDNQTMACTGFTATPASSYVGFTSLPRKSHFLWKIATGSEGATFDVTGGGTAYNEAVCFAYSGAVGVGANGATDNNFNSPALAVVNNNSMEVAVLSFDNSSSNAAGPAGWTRRINGNGSHSTWAAERAANSGTTTSSNFTGTGDTTFGFGLFNLILAASSGVATVPGAPTLTAATPGDTTVTLTWTVPASNGGSTITNYKIETSPDGSTGWSTVTTVGNVLTYTHTGRTNGTTYYYRVSAINSVGTGSTSNVLSATPTAPTVPGAPTGVAGTAGNTQVSLTWTAPASNGGSAITGYKEQHAVNPPGTSWSTAVATGSTSTAYTATGLTNGTGYIFRIAATNAVGDSSYSTASSTVTPTGGGGAAPVFKAMTTAFGNNVVNKPTVSVGDMLVIIWHDDEGNTGTISGWTSAGNGTFTGVSGTRRHGVLYRVCDGTEPASFTVSGIFTSPGTSYSEVICMSYSGATSVGGFASTGTAVTAGISVVTNDMEIVMGDYDYGSKSTTAPSGFTRRLDGNGSYNAYICERVAASSGTSATADLSAANSGSGNCGTLDFYLRS
jgi:hypothetical protein